MRIALGSDEAAPLTDALERDLRARGHELVLIGALAHGDDPAWPNVGRRAGQAVAGGECSFGIVCCWTGTGVSMAANKVQGARAALCADAETAAGAREWNDANVLALSLRSTPVSQVKAILDAWFSAAVTEKPEYRAMIEGLDGPSKARPASL